eukprot:TRINITY_DN520_c0_g1_i10.p1 TRINITY_DN520_c0_g1~~TRINITY_DN520_c0_g1_i10.p1  ORF type:complete len:120 (-),score=40.80 TRINITY_DN520_c0_g1_i10:195-554(-)
MCIRDRYMGKNNKRSKRKMVCVPKLRKTICPRCNKHRPHKVSQYKKGKESTLSQGRRRYDNKQRGYGGQKKPVFKKKAKTTKKVTLRLECNVCKYKRHVLLGRCKTFVLGEQKKVESKY